MHWSPLCGRCRSPRPGSRWRLARHHRSGVQLAPTGPAARWFRCGATGLPNDARRDGDYPSCDAGAKGFSARAPPSWDRSPRPLRSGGGAAIARLRNLGFTVDTRRIGGLHHCTADAALAIDRSTRHVQRRPPPLSSSGRTGRQLCLSLMGVYPTCSSVSLLTAARATSVRGRATASAGVNQPAACVLPPAASVTTGAAG